MYIGRQSIAWVLCNNCLHCYRIGKVLHRWSWECVRFYTSWLVISFSCLYTGSWGWRWSTWISTSFFWQVCPFPLFTWLVSPAHDGDLTATATIAIAKIPAVAPPIPRHCLFFHIYLVDFRHRCFSFQFIYKYFKLIPSHTLPCLI